MKFRLFSKNKANKGITPTNPTYPKNYLPFTTLKSPQNKNDLLVYMFNNVAEVNAVVSKIAEVAANVPIQHVVKQANGKTKDKGKTDIIQLLEKPNQFFNGKTLTANSITSYYITGNVYLNKVKPVGFERPSQIYLLPSNRVYPIITSSYEPFGEIKQGTDIRQEEIKKYNWQIDNRFVAIEPQEMIHIKDTSISNDNKFNIVGQSRLFSAIRNVESLSYMYDTINTILGKNGALGFVKKNQKQGEMFNAIDPVEKERIESAFYQYGAVQGKQPIFFTDQDLEYVRILTQLSDFLPIELSDKDFKMLCKVLGGFPDVLLSATDTTFANMKEAGKMLYTNIIMPVLDNYLEAITLGLGLPENEAIIADYSGIEALQADQNTKMQTQQTTDNVWINRYEKGLITLNELLIALELPTQTNGNTYANTNTQPTGAAQ